MMMMTMMMMMMMIGGGGGRDVDRGDAGLASWRIRRHRRRQHLLRRRTEQGTCQCPPTHHENLHQNRSATFAANHRRRRHRLKHQISSKSLTGLPGMKAHTFSCLKIK